MDFTQIILAFLAGLPATIAAIGALIVSVRGNKKIDDNTKVTIKAASETRTEAINAASHVASQAVAAAKQVAQTAGATQDAIQGLTSAVNGRMDKQIQTEKDASFLEGKMESFKHEVADLIRGISDQAAADRVRLDARITEHAERNAQQLELFRADIRKLLEAKA